MISLDDGINFSNLAVNESNDGSYDFMVPNLENTDVRFKIICANNIFFSITPEPVSFIASALPVELINLSATAFEKQIDLNWETASEVNNAGFEIHRSTHPDRGFESIGWMNGYGTTNQSQKYSYVDQKVETGRTYYYQLKQMDYDEQFELSKIVSAKLAADDLVIDLRPNPAQDQLTISLALEGDHRMEISILDLLGRTVVSSTAAFRDFQQQEFNVDHLLRGVYFLRIKLGTGELMVRKFVKE